MECARAAVCSLGEFIERKYGRKFSILYRCLACRPIFVCSHCVDLRSLNPVLFFLFVDLFS